MADIRSSNTAEASPDSLSTALAGVGEVMADPGSVHPDLALATSLDRDSPTSKEKKLDDAAGVDGTWEISESQTAKTYEDDKFGFWQAAAINTLNMFGTGPFITVPFLFAATAPAGPQALIGYAMAAFVCTFDSMIWGELSSMMPYSGGTYIYLREAYGKDKIGRFMAFQFIFQFLISAPIEIASGYIAMAQYLAYITGITNWVYNSLIGCGFCVLSILVLYQDLSFVGKMTIALWVGTVGAIVFCICAGYAHFDPSLLAAPPGWNSPAALPGFIYSLGTAMRIGIYDFAGYYDACQMGDEVKNPRRVIPRATVGTCGFLVFVFFAVVLAIAGVVPWYGPDGFVEKVLSGHKSANYVMSTFCEILFGRPFAIFFTIVVVYTIFGSCFALLLGYAFIPYSAARDRYFYAWFGHEHATKKGLADYSLLVLGAISCVLCFVDLGILIEGMLTTRLIIQFMAQAVGVMILRKKAPNAIRVFKTPLYPLPIIINLIGFTFVFGTTSNYLISGNTPLLEIGILIMIVGAVLYFPFAKVNGFWPFEKSATTSEGSCETEMITHTTGEGSMRPAKKKDGAEQDAKMDKPADEATHSPHISAL